MNDKLINYKTIINKALDEYLPQIYPHEIFDSMRYSVLADGKRIRPILALEIGQTLGADIESILPTACAIEMLHAQSLIHDDLPCMDNDDFRRGIPTNHKVFGEAVATLAGDALLSFAPQIIIQKTPKTVDSTIVLKILEEFMIGAGVYGIISGQVVDIMSEGKNIDENTLNFIHKYKTGALFKLAVRVGALIANVDDNKKKMLDTYAEKLGLAFQISDDILDVTSTLDVLGKTPGKDMQAKKSTYVTLYGVEKSKYLLHNIISESCDIIENNFNSELLLYITRNVEMRNK